MSLIWPAQRIAAAIAEHMIDTAVPVESDQVQPASLDLRLGRAPTPAGELFAGARPQCRRAPGTSPPTRSI